MLLAGDGVGADNRGGSDEVRFDSSNGVVSGDNGVENGSSVAGRTGDGGVCCGGGIRIGDDVSNGICDWLSL